MDSTFELCWGTCQGVALPELIDVAGTTGFAALTIPPELYFLSLRDGFRNAELRERLLQAGTDEIQYQVSGRRLLATQHGVVFVEPGDFVRIPAGVASTTISETPGRYIATVSAHRMLRTHPATRVGKPWDISLVAEARAKVLATQSSVH